MGQASARKKDRPAAEGGVVDRILGSAEKHFAAAGYSGAKVRTILEEAGANLGLLQYYWGGKAQLYRAAFERRLKPIMDERLRRLGALEQAAGLPAVRDVVRASVEPILAASRASRRDEDYFTQFYCQALVDPAPEVRSLMAEFAGPAAACFERLIAQACANLPARELAIRVGVVRGGLIYLQTREMIGADEDGDAAAIIVDTLTATLAAPSAASTA